MKKIAILGCGWLGLPLAKKLISHHFTVSGSTTSELKLDTLKHHGIQPFLIQVTQENISGNIAAFLNNSDVLIIDIPPKLRGENKENFVQKINNCIPYIENSQVKKLIFISSTSVFDDDNATITDASIPNSLSEVGLQLIQVEQLLQTNKNFDTTIIRFGGLVGHDRHPIKMLAGRNNIENPKAPINLIHQEDCIEIIIKVIEQNQWNTAFNAASPHHPNREDYYQKQALSLNLPLPNFDHTKPSVGKTIDSSFVSNVLKHQFTWIENL